MQELIENLLKISKRAEAISSQMRISMLEFDASIEAEDMIKQEEIRVKIHQLVDDQLDLQLETKHIKDQNEKSVMDRIRRGNLRR